MNLLLVKVLVLALATGDDVHAQAQDSVTSAALRGSVVGIYQYIHVTFFHVHS